MDILAFKFVFITFKCNRVYYAAYNNEWYVWDPKITKDLLPILLKATKPVFLSAGKVFPITMATFCSVRYENNEFTMKSFMCIYSNLYNIYLIFY